MLAEGAVTYDELKSMPISELETVIARIKRNLNLLKAKRSKARAK